MTSTAMTSGNKPKYGPPKIPATPSKTINSMLEQRFSQGYDTPIKAAVAYFICGIFQAITTLYNMINPDKTKHSHSFWMASCGVVAALLVTNAFLVYHIVMACSVLAKLLLFWGCISLGLLSGGICVSGMVFFDKDGAAPPKAASAAHSFESKRANFESKTTYDNYKSS